MCCLHFVHFVCLIFSATCSSIAIAESLRSSSVGNTVAGGPSSRAVLLLTTTSLPSSANHAEELEVFSLKSFAAALAKKGVSISTISTKPLLDKKITTEEQYADLHGHRVAYAAFSSVFIFLDNKFGRTLPEECQVDSSALHDQKFPQFTKILHISILAQFIL